QLLEAADADDLGAVEAERCPGLAGRELERDDAHADQVGPVDALEALGDHRADAEEAGALRRPVTRRAGAVLLAAQDDERGALRLVVLRRVVDERLRAALLREVAGVPALDTIEQLVPEADVREGPADHHLVVAASRSVGVEVLAVDAVVGEILA